MDDGAGPCASSALPQSDSLRAIKRKCSKMNESDEPSGKSARNRPIGICRPTEREHPYPIFLLKDALFEKFKDVRIYVDSDVSIPTQIWFLPSTGDEGVTCPLNGNCYKVVPLATDGQLSLGNSQQKWFEKREEEGPAKMLSLFEKLPRYLEFDHHNLKWKAMPVLSHEEEVENRLPGDATRSARLTELLTMIRSTFDVNHFALALFHEMQNAEGRHAIYLLLQCACLITYGPMFSDRATVGIYAMGTSGAPLEAFPVDVMNSAGRKRSSDILCDLSSYHTGSTESSNVPVCTAKKRSVLADLIVASGHEPNWPRFLVIVEIQNQALTRQCMSQLIRKMAAPLMHQSEVFGLLVNDQMAKIVQLQHDFQQKNITMRTSTYNFTSPVTYNFSVTEMNRLFSDLVAVIDYAKDSIKEVNHGF